MVCAVILPCTEQGLSGEPIAPPTCSGLTSARTIARRVMVPSTTIALVAACACIARESTRNSGGYPIARKQQRHSAQTAYHLAPGEHRAGSRQSAVGNGFMQVGNISTMGLRLIPRGVMLCLHPRELNCRPSKVALDVCGLDASTLPVHEVRLGGQESVLAAQDEQFPPLFVVDTFLELVEDPLQGLQREGRQEIVASGT